MLRPASNYTFALPAPRHCVVKIPRRWNPIAVGILPSPDMNQAKQKYNYSPDGTLAKEENYEIKSEWKLEMQFFGWT